MASKLRKWEFEIEMRDGLYNCSGTFAEDPGTAIMQAHVEIQNHFVDGFRADTDRQGRPVRIKVKKLEKRREPGSYRIVNAKRGGISYPEFALMVTPDVGKQHPVKDRMTELVRVRSVDTGVRS